MPDTSAFSCPNCQIGICHPKRTTYLTVYNNMLVSVPNTAVWQCDICQYQEFEHHAITRLETLMEYLILRPSCSAAPLKLRRLSH
jgi:hypothetical protein